MTTFQASDIAHVFIYPPIGIARVGDSDEYFLGPEFDPHANAPSRYKDHAGRIKRQGARFRLYAFDAEGSLLGEVSPEVGKTTWRVHLANKKAAWFTFNGAASADKAFRGEDPETPPRNNHPEFGEIVRVGGRFKSDERRAHLLEIDGREKEISGPNKRRDKRDADSFEFRGVFRGGASDRDGTSVYLGEIRTDEEGRLIVLGGHGVSEPIDSEFSEDKFEKRRATIRNWIANYANNDFWHDDTSDGPVDATVALSDGRTLPAEGGAWVIVTPPDFAPDVENIASLYDVMEEVALGAKLRPDPGCPPLNPPDRVDYARDIQPIFRRINDYRWVSPLGLRGHGSGKPGEFIKSMEQVFSGTDEKAYLARNHFFSMLRTPAYAGIDPETGAHFGNSYGDESAIRQATPEFMPPLSGDEGDRVNGRPETWLTLTRLQYKRFASWAKGEARSEGPKELSDPALLTKNALQACAGGAFFPGIEMTVIARLPELYFGAFRLDHDRLEAGDVTKFMACPWQADFYECRDDWWPAQRPDTVITEAEIKEITQDFEVAPSDPNLLFFDRVRWDRSLDRRPWPDTEYVAAKLASRPGEGVREFVRRIGTLAVDALVARPSPIRGNRLVNPWRAQYLIQESLDQVAGRCFLPRAPTPDEVFSAREGATALGQVLDALDEALSPAKVRARWEYLREAHNDAAGKILGIYLAAVGAELRGYFESTLEALRQQAKDNSSASELAALFASATADPQDFPEEFGEDGTAFRDLRAGELRTALENSIFTDASSRQGDMAMVDDWKSLGFVRDKTVRLSSGAQVQVKAETERDVFSAASFREHFYKLMNVSRFPEYYEYSSLIVEEILADTQRLIDFKLEYDSQHPESFIPYTAAAFTAKLQEIYEIFRARAARPQQYVYKQTRNEYAAAAILGFAVFNQVDGAWLRNIADAGPSTDVTSLLFQIWSDEFGNGDPALHHGNLFTALLHQLKYNLADVGSKEYSENSSISEAQFVGPVFELAISQHSKKYLPELLGMTLYLEWEVLDLAAGIPRLDYYGIDSQFYRMHVGIDNASDGHGAKARQAVVDYLDQVLQEGGPEAQQEHWKRIWRGFVAFATTGYDMFQSFEKNGQSSLSPDSVATQMPRTPADDVNDLMARKMPFGQLNHMSKHLGVYQINNLFDMPGTFIEELRNSAWIVAGRPEESRFLNYLTTFDGPMYKVFNSDDIAIWRNWIAWLGKEGETQRPKEFISKGDAMMLLVSELHAQMVASEGHHIYTIRYDASAETLAELFNSRTPIEIMRALKADGNGYVVPYQPARSPLIVDLLRPGRDMGRHLDRHFTRLQGRVGRMVVFEWIAAGCPIPGEAAPSAEFVKKTLRREPALLVHQYGMGSVH